MDTKIELLLAAQNAVLSRIADALDILASASAPKAPNYRRELGEFPSFDWAGIGAEVTHSDDHGVTAVRWGGYIWTRRAPQNKFGEAIWFSRPDGKDADGNVKYLRLVTFNKPAEAEPLPKKTEALARGKI